MSGHVHDMKPLDPGVHKCSSCAFKCTTSALPQVRKSPELHVLVKPGSVKAGEVWNG